MQKILRTTIASMLIAAASCNNAAEKDSATTTDSNTNQTTTTAKADLPAGTENILGDWTLDKKLRDDNGNHVVDGDEEKTNMEGKTNTMKFNADGTCKFETVMDGTYKIINTEDGRKKLEIQDLQGTPYPLALYIVSLSQNELVINMIGGGSGFEIYKRP